MKPECAAAIRAAVGKRELSDKEMRGIEERLNGAAQAVRRQDPQAWAGLSAADKYTAAAKFARSSQLEQMAQAHSDALGRFEKNAKYDALVAALPAIDRVKGMLADHFMTHGKDNASLDGEVQGLQDYYLSRISEKTDRLLQDPTKNEAVARELRGEDSGDPEAKGAAKELGGLMETLRQRSNRAGIHVNRLENYGSPQVWDPFRIFDEEAFVKDARAALDPREYTNIDGSPMKEAQIDAMLRESHLTLATGGANKRAAQGVRRGSGKLGSRYNAPRQLHFKDADAFLGMMRKYGISDNMGVLVRGHVHRLAKDIAIAERHGNMAGTDVPARLERANSDALAAAKNLKEKVKVHAQYTLFKKMWDVQLNGHAVGNSSWAARLAAVRAWVSASRLGSLVSQQPSDTAMSLTYLKAMGFDRPDMGSFAKAIGSPERKQLLRDMGAWMDNQHAAESRFGETETWGRISNWLHNGVYVASGMRAADRGASGLLADSVFNTIGRRTSKYERIADMSEADQAWAKRFGITQEHWDVMRMADIDHGNGGDQHMMTPQSVYDIPNDHLLDMANKKAAAVNAGLKEREASFKAQVAREREWAATRALKLANWKGKIQSIIDRAQAKASVRAGHAEGVAAARAEVLRAQVERAEVETDIHRYLATEDHQGRMAGYLDAVEDGANRERAVIRQRVHPDNKSDAVVENLSNTPGINEQVNRTAQDFATQVGGGGERLGQKRARAEARISAAEKHLADAERATSDRLDEKQDEFDSQYTQRVKDVAEFSDQMRNRAASIQDRIKAFEGERKKYTEDTIGRLKDDTVKSMLRTYREVYHAGGRGFAGASLYEQARMGLLHAPAGTWIGEALRALYAIRMVPFGLAMTHLHDIPAGMDGWKPRANYIARYAAGQMLATGLAVQAKHLINGENPEDMTKLAFVKKLAAGAVLGPLLATVLFGSQGEHTEAGADLGPVADTAGLALNLGIRGEDELQRMAGIGQHPNKDRWSNEKYAAQWLSFLRQNVPFMNMWYTKAAFNHLIYQQVQEHVSPGYNDRVQKRMQAENRNSWWGQGDLLPSRAPDWGAAIGRPSAAQ